MDYTKNYHLPQWKKEDRIMMEDFNEAMAGIESGLAGIRDAGAADKTALAGQIEAVRQEAASRAGANLAQGKAELQKGLFRLAYNQCAHLLEMDETPALDGIFMQQLNAETTPNNCVGIDPHQDGMWCASSGPGGSIEAVQKTIKVITPLTLVKNDPAASQKAVLTIEPIGAVCIRRLDLSGSYSGNDSRKDGLFHVVLTNQTRGIVELERDMGGGIGGATYGLDVELSLNAYLHGGDMYRLEVTPLEVPISGTFTYKVGDGMRLTYYDQAADGFSGTLSHTFAKGETGYGGLVLARYDPYDKGGVLTASWGGREQTPLRTRTFTDCRGRKVVEAEFRFTDPIPETSTVTLKATVPSCGDVVLYNWCAALL